MGDDAAAMLFCPPLGPVRLAGSTPVVLGRSRACDLAVPGGDASRRHAEVRHGERGWVVRDLGSTNGTLVNGRKLEGEHVLESGDRIGIGSSVVTFCRVVRDELDSVLGEGAEAKTIVSYGPTGGRAFEGSLDEIPPFALLQVLEMGRKTGVLRLDAPESGEGRIWLVEGAPVHAETEKQQGFDAAARLVNVERGSFRFEPGAKIPDTTIRASVTELLLEASRLKDEGAL
jgi:pSer/pThr/pTyr-binding forkhead associated (FHA) protein